MVNQRQVFSQLKKQIKSGNIPSKLTDEQRLILTRCFSKHLYRSFSFKQYSEDPSSLLNGIINALKLAEDFSKKLLQSYYTINNYGKAYIHINGFAKQTDVFLIQKFIQNFKKIEKEKQKINKVKQQAKQKIVSTKTHSFTTDELAKLIKELTKTVQSNIGKSK